ncbi:MAG: LON peptidase substrate-binding domain-containing protein [Actinomycetota bacterium]
MGERIPLFPLHTILLPHTDLGLHVFEQRYRDLVSCCLNDSREFGVALIKRGNEVGGPADPHVVGTSALIAGYARLPDGRYLLEVEGTRRFRIDATSSNGSYPSADVSWLPEPIGNFGDARLAGDEVDRLFAAYRLRCGDGDLPVKLPVDPITRSYLVASLLRIDPPEKQRLLELDSADVRLREEAEILRREIMLLDHLHAKRL